MATPAVAVAVKVPDNVPSPLAKITVKSSVTVTSATPPLTALTTGAGDNTWPLMDPSGCTNTSNQMFDRDTS